MLFERYSGADNRFLLTTAALAGAAAERLAREVCRRELFAGQRADGLLVVEKRGENAPRMTIYNADGSRPEACGNGLRCVAWHLARTEQGTTFTIATDAGDRRARVVEARGERADLFVEMGTVEHGTLEKPWPRVRGLIRAQRASVGNPHCVLRVEDERELDTRAIGQVLQTHSAFPRGVNVGFLAQREGRWCLRVFERGVGETAACGTGACAAAATVADQPGEVSIHMRGGELRVVLDAQRNAQLLGQATYHGTIELHGEAIAWATCSKS